MSKYRGDSVLLGLGCAADARVWAEFVILLMAAVKSKVETGIELDESQQLQIGTFT
jgi:hypothetical protein